MSPLSFEDSVSVPNFVISTPFNHIAHDKGSLVREIAFPFNIVYSGILGMY